MAGKGRAEKGRGKTVCFSIAVKGHSQYGQFQHGCKGSWSIKSASASLERCMTKKSDFSMVEYDS
jgi:hypothetical protein